MLPIKHVIIAIYDHQRIYAWGKMHLIKSVGFQKLHLLPLKCTKQQKTYSKTIINQCYQIIIIFIILIIIIIIGGDGGSSSLCTTEGQL